MMAWLDEAPFLRAWLAGESAKHFTSVTTEEKSFAFGFAGLMDQTYEEDDISIYIMIINRKILNKITSNTI